MEIKIEQICPRCMESTPRTEKDGATTCLRCGFVYVKSATDAKVRFSPRTSNQVRPAELPPVTQQPILHIDGTPDSGYVMRILRAYRENCNSMWATSTDGSECDNPLLQMMNEMQVKRAELLDEAIKKLA